MTDRSQMLQSPAYQALSPAGRRVLTAVEHEVARCGGVISMSHANYRRLTGLSQTASLYGLKQMALLGFFSVAQKGPCSRRIITITFTDGWVGLDADTAKRRQLQALLPKRQPAPKPVRPQRQTPSLPRMPWDVRQ